MTKRLVSAVVRKDLNDLLEYTTLNDTYKEGSKAWFEVLFLGDKAEDPVIVDVAEKLGVKIGIMAGQINHIQNEPLGVLIIAIEGSEDIIEKAKVELENRVYRVKLLGYQLKEAK